MDLSFSEDPPDPESYLALFETTGWNDMYRRTADELAQAIRRSWLFLGAYREGKLVGAGRVVSDGVQYAVIFDMIVAPEQQGRGIGTAILRHFLRRCESAGIRDILLFAAEGVAPFYRRHGFVDRPESAPGMILRRKQPSASRRSC